MRVRLACSTLFLALWSSTAAWAGSTQPAAAALGDSAALLAPTRAAPPVSAPAWAQVVTGEDLSAWQRLENLTLTGPDAVAAYRGFVVTYASSPLAEAAWSRLVALGGDAPWSDDPALLDVLVDVRGRFEAHQKSLGTPVRSRIASIDLSEPDDDAAAQR